MVSHAVHDGQCSISSRNARRLRRDSQRIDECLRVVFADVREYGVNVSPNVLARCLNSSDDLWNDL